VLQFVGRRPGIVRQVEPFELAPTQATLPVVRIAGAIGTSVMPSMRRDPRDRAAFHREYSEYGNRVVEPTRDAQALVREHPMVSQRNAEAAGELEQNGCDDDARPGKREGISASSAPRWSTSKPIPVPVPSVGCGWDRGFAGKRLQGRDALAQLRYGTPANATRRCSPISTIASRAVATGGSWVKP